MRYDDAQRRHVNKTRYLDPIPLEVHEYQISGYQVFDKWLKDIRERRPYLDDIRTYCRMATSFRLTPAIQQEIDIVPTWKITVC